MTTPNKQADDLVDVLRSVARLYEAYYRTDNDIARQRQDVEHALRLLMMDYDAYLD